MERCYWDMVRAMNIALFSREAHICSRGEQGMWELSLEKKYDYEVTKFKGTNLHRPLTFIPLI